MAELDGVEMVCKFLEERKIPEHVICKFRNDKMDATAIAFISDDMLMKDYCLHAKGDVYALRSFCKNQEGQGTTESKHEERKRELLQQICRGKETRLKDKEKKESTASASTSGIGKEKVKMRKVALGWLQYDEVSSHYKAVRAPKGGGTRIVSVSCQATKSDLIQEAVALFLSQKTEKDFDIELGNFKGEPITHDMDGDFTVEQYYATHKLPRARFYLMTKKKRQSFEVSDSDDSDDLMQSVFERIDDITSSLIGSSEDRNNLKDEQDLAYQQSLQADQQKDKEKQDKEQKEKEVEVEKQQDENLRIMRETRTPPEPKESETHILIAVRHPTKGTVRRRFTTDAKMSSVYDWAGSLTTEPKHFFLKYVHCVGKSWIQPSSNISDVRNEVLYMEPCDEPPPLNTDDWEVSFLGYGPLSSDDCDDTYLPDPDLSNLTGYILSYDEDELNEQRGRAFRQMVQEQQQQSVIQGVGSDYSNLLDLGVKDVNVKRSSIFSYMLELYNDENVCFQDLQVSFQDEPAADLGGVSRDLFSGFWEEAYAAFFDGESIKVPFVPPHQMPEAQEIFVKLGRVFSHGFVLTNTVPVRFCKVSVMSMLFGPEKIPESYILPSFLEFVTPWESEVLERALQGTSSCDDDLISLFSRMGMRCVPAKNPEKLHQQVIQMAKSEFVYKPAMLLSWLRQGIPEEHYKRVWSGFTSESVSTLFSSLTPTTENVVKNITAHTGKGGDDGELTPAEDRVMYFLKCFVRGLDREMLGKFLRFTTGATVAPLSPITVVFNGASGLNRAPSASTCARVLSLSTNYNSLQEFKSEFSKVLASEEAFVMSLV